VIFPPVRQDWIQPRAAGEVGSGFLCVNALVPYKNVDVIIKAFNQLGLPLTIVGDGPEKEKLVRMAGRNITFLSNLSDRELADLYKSSKALVFAAEEDFGMTPVEMQFAGRPVIAYGKGGALETVDSAGSRPTGVHFYDLTTDAISAAVRYFTENERIFTVENCQQKAREFSEVQFFRNLELWLDGIMSDATPEVLKVDKGS
jgi:glycosyltransferase involved in cell wall biosynthesis